MEFKEVAVQLICENYFKYENKELTHFTDVVEFLKEYLKEKDREVFGVINLKRNCEPINFNIVSVGDISNSIAHPREVLKSAILSNAAAIILFHNHPSGDPTPSKEDIKTTKKMQKACKIMGIELLDHIVVGAGGKRYESVVKILKKEKEK